MKLEAQAPAAGRHGGPWARGTDRRTFLAACGGAVASFAAGPSIDETLRSGIARRKIPCVAAMAADAKGKTLYSGAFGARTDSIFAIASMTKAITTVAALQLVEQGKVSLTEPVSKHLPQLADLQVWDGTSLHPAKKAVTLHHLLRWVDEGVSPPRAQRILLDRDESNDGSSMALDAHGNPLGGIRSPYVDVPAAKYAPVNTAAEPLIANPSEYVRANGLQGAQTMCRLSAYQEPFSQAQLRELYGSKREYLRKFEARLNELERASWSLPLYHATIMADVSKTDF